MAKKKKVSKRTGVKQKTTKKSKAGLSKVDPFGTITKHSLFKTKFVSTIKDDTSIR